MTEQDYPPSDQHQSAVVRALGNMPRWKRRALIISLIIGVVGAGGEAGSRILHRNDVQSPAATSTVNSNSTTSGGGYKPPGSSGFATGQPQSTSTGDSNTTPVPVATDHPTLTTEMTPWMRRLGLSFFVGIVVGFLFRTFLKLATLLSVLVGGAFLAASYFGFLNVDLTSMKTEYSSSISWLTDQAYRLKDVLFHALPSSTAAGAGFLSGFKRR